MKRPIKPVKIFHHDIQVLESQEFTLEQLDVAVKEKNIPRTALFEVRDDSSCNCPLEHMGIFAEWDEVNQDYDKQLAQYKIDLEVYQAHREAQKKSKGELQKEILK